MRARVILLLEELRRRVPRALVPLLVEVRFRLAWARESVREDARAQMRFLLEHTRPEADVEQVARAYVRSQVRRGELRWHPEMITRLRVVGIEHLLEARDRHQGVIANFMHHGHFDGAFPSMTRYGVQFHWMAYPYILRDDAPGWVKQHVRVGTTGGNVVSSTEIGTDGIVDLLKNDAVVAIASDVPGRTPVRFVGRDVLGSFGAARIATETGSPVVVVSAEWDGEGPYVRVHPPLEPASFASPRDLLDAMLALHEPAIVRWPEATDIPLSRWGTVAEEARHG